jgi:N-acetylmuramoyl-L-alanine amidase
MLFDGLNACAIGIELANAGNDTDALAWARKQPGFTSVTACHRKGGGPQEWEAYPKAQVDTALAVAHALVARYNLDDVTGHDCVAPERKDDPGPAFPMKAFRESLGFHGLPSVWHVDGTEG